MQLQEDEEEETSLASGFGTRLDRALFHFDVGRIRNLRRPILREHSHWQNSHWQRSRCPRLKPGDTEAARRFIFKQVKEFKKDSLAAEKRRKVAEKQARKLTKKEAKKLGITVEEFEKRERRWSIDVSIDSDDGDVAVIIGVNGDEDAAMAAEAEEPPKKKKLRAKELIRRERLPPPPRIRIMESSQPDYTAPRLENIAIAFRDQPVLKPAAWGVGIGLVEANGAVKTAQPRILAGELEPTAGDVAKSRKGLRVAMLRQEFIDEIDLTRSLREEFMSVFTEEAQIMSDLADAEKELENMAGDGSNADKMQEVSDRMAKLQNKADVKNAGAADSRVSKIMDLMEFESEEGGEFVRAVAVLHDAAGEQPPHTGRADEPPRRTGEGDAGGGAAALRRVRCRHLERSVLHLEGGHDRRRHRGQEAGEVRWGLQVLHGEEPCVQGQGGGAVLRGRVEVSIAPVIDLEELQKPKKKDFGGAKTANIGTMKNKGVKNAKRKQEK